MNSYLAISVDKTTASLAVAFYFSAVSVGATVPNHFVKDCPFATLSPSDSLSGLPRLKAAADKVIPIDQNAFLDSETRSKLATTYGKALSRISTPMGGLEYERRLREFAAENNDDRAQVIRLSRPGTVATNIKIHLRTGELLISDALGRVCVYTRLPVGDRALGKFRDTVEIAQDLLQPVYARVSDGKTKLFSRLTMGESIPVRGFTSKASVRLHFNKHVLDLRPNETIEDFEKRIERKIANSENAFPEIREAFLKDWKTAGSSTAKRHEVYEKYVQMYENAAEEFLRANRPSILTATQPDADSLALSTRLDVLTNEFAVIDRSSGQVITYYRIGSLQHANNRLQFKLGLPRAESPLEYLLSNATAP